MMFTIKRNDVPQYLRRGCFYNSLDAQDDDAFEIPVDCFKDDPSVESEPALVHLLQTVRYWGLFVMPAQICEFIFEKGGNKIYERLLNKFPEFESYLENVRNAKEALIDDRIRAAINAGLHVSTVRMLHEKGYPWNETACESAAQMNDLECLMYLHTEGCLWDRRTLLAAAEHNSLACLQYVLDFDEFDTGSKSEAMSTAARYGNIDCIRVLYMAGVAWDIRTTVAAILNNQLDSLRFLHARGCEFPTNSCWWVVRYHGNIEVLQFLHEEAGADLTGTLLTAAEHGNLRCMRYAHQHGEAWHPDICMMAARGGHLHCLRYAHKHGCPWDDETAQAAVGARSWGCLQYALQHGSGWFTHIVLAGFIGFALWRCMRSDDSGLIRYSLEWWSEKLTPCALAFLITVAYYKKHLGHYLSEHNAEHIMLSYLCLVVMYWTMEGIFESSWLKIVLRVLAFLVFGLQVVLLNARRVQPPELPNWYKLNLLALIV